MTEFLNLLDGLLGSAFYFPWVLLGVGLFFTVYLGFPQVRYFAHAWRVLGGRYTRSDAPGDTSHFQALATALSGTVGTGNIGGVALALHLGGPAALFWMWATAFFGMTTKFVEVTVSHKYRTVDERGEMAGGPMFYMERALNMKWLAVFFAIATVISSFGTGNMPQSNNIAVGMEDAFGIAPIVTGGVLAIALALVIIGGISRIAKVTSTIVPIMGVIYVTGAFIVILANVENLIPSLVSVFSDAFTGSAAAGGFLGASFAYAFNRGVNRGLFSNEAGQGSAPIAHASARGDEPVSEGMVAILEPFIDTILICTLTGLAILASGVWQEKTENRFQSFDLVVISGNYDEQKDQPALFAYLNGQENTVSRYSGSLVVTQGEIKTPGVTLLHNRSVAEAVRVLAADQPYSGTIKVEQGSFVPAQGQDALQIYGESLVHSVSLTSLAFSRSPLGDWGPSLVSIGLLLFAFSTAIAWSYYGDRAVTYLVGVRWVMPYRVLYVAGFFAAAISDTSLIWLISAVTVAMMTLPNLFGILLLCRDMKGTVKEYWSGFSR